MLPVQKQKKFVLCLLPAALGCLVSLTNTTGCTTTGGKGGGGGYVMQDNFPSKTDLKKIAAKPKPVVKVLPEASIETWDLQGPFPNVLGHTALTRKDVADDPVATWAFDNFPEVESKKGGKPAMPLQAQLSCAARERAHFALNQPGIKPVSDAALLGKEKDAEISMEMSAPLAEFVAMRCGIPERAFSTISYYWADTQILEYVDKKGKKTGKTERKPYKIADILTDPEAQKDIRSLWERVLDTHPTNVGIGWGQANGRIMVVVTYNNSDSDVARLHLQDFSQIPESVRDGSTEKQVTLRGTWQGESLDAIQAVINQGAYQAVNCERDVNTKLPDFAFTCPVAASDALAEMALFIHREGRQLGEGIFAGLIVNPDTPSKSKQSQHFERKGYAVTQRKTEENTVNTADTTDTTDTTDTASITGTTAALLEQLNSIRKTAGLDPVELSSEQSASMLDLAPHYFYNPSVAAMEQESGIVDQTALATEQAKQEAVQDTISLGVMAGYDVAGNIYDGDFGSVTESEADASTLLWSALRRPHARMTLLDPKADVVAFGPLLEDRYSQLIYSTYRLMPPANIKADHDAVLQHLAKARKKRGVAGTGIGEVPMPDVENDLAQRLINLESPDKLLHQFLEVSVDRMQYSFRGYILETHDLEDIRWPDDLLTDQQTYVALAVAPVRPKGAAWARWVILVSVYVDPKTKAF